MNSEMTVHTPAKINILLEIGPKLSSGFHELHSLFLMVDLLDTLQVTLIPDSSECRIESGPLQLPGHNTLVHAWDLFCRDIGRPLGCRAVLKKRIPSGAGLGGGSSNGAGMLRVLNELLGRPVSESRLLELARNVGSDVPFFLGSPAAWVEGTGEVLKSIQVREFYVMLLKPDIDISTPWAYQALDAYRGEDADNCTFKTLRSDCITSYEQRPPAQWKFFNSFEPVLDDRYPEVSELRRMLIQCGATYTGISGSGSAVFGFFNTREDISLCERSLQHITSWRQCVKTLAKSPIEVYNTL